MSRKKAIIIGAGPAGLTAALELLRKTDIKPVIYEKSADIGGISKTVNYRGNRIDLGGHRFFSKSDLIMNWWQEVLPLQGKPASDDLILKRDLPFDPAPEAPDPEQQDKVMLLRQRLSRIFFLRKFFDYPISLSLKTFLNLGLFRIIKIGLSYVQARLFPIRQEKSLEDFFINRFGRELYLTFFKDYTEKVWGIPCRQIGPEWGAQRVKGLSVIKAVGHAIKSIFSKDSTLGQKNTETSLIEQFMYPKFGPGQLWEEVADKITEKGGEIHFQKEIIGLTYTDQQIESVTVKDIESGQAEDEPADYFFSTMPVKDLIESMEPAVPGNVLEIASGLKYRDFLIVGLLLKQLKIKNQTAIRTIKNLIPDNWIYIQERDVKAGRLQIFNNWSPYMVKDPDTVWIGVEYFCNEGDELWCMEDKAMQTFAIDELAHIDIINKSDVLDSVVVRMQKTYPAYFGSYEQFHVVSNFTDTFKNLFLIGRNGMHKYNNQDHSMLTALTAVSNIVNNRESKANIWHINTEDEYHELKV